MSSGGGPVKRGPLGRQPSISSLEQGLNSINTPRAPITIYPGPGAKHVNMAKADLELVQRLQQLKGSSSSNKVPSEAEMEQRLAKLKGLPTDYYTKPSAAKISTDHRTDHQKTQDLLSRMMEENELELSLPRPDENLQSRLSQLQCDPDSAADRPAAAARPPSEAPLLDSPGLPPGLDDISEVALLLQEASAAASADANNALARLHRDAEIAPVLASVKEKQRRAGDSRSAHRRAPARTYQCTSSSEKERMSDDSSEGDTRRRVMVKKMSRSSSDKKDSLTATAADDKNLTAEDEEEVSRIVTLYTKRATDKKKKKKLLKKKATGDQKLRGKCEAKVSATDSSSALSESDLEASDSEKLSDSSS